MFFNQCRSFKSVHIFFSLIQVMHGESIGNLNGSRDIEGCISISRSHPVIKKIYCCIIHICYAYRWFIHCSILSQFYTFNLCYSTIHAYTTFFFNNILFHFISYSLFFFLLFKLWEFYWTRYHYFFCYTCIASKSNLIEFFFFIIQHMNRL